MRWLRVLEMAANTMLYGAGALFAVLAAFDLIHGQESMFYQKMTLAGVMYLAASVTTTGNLR